jgi:excisionase family DNA binding protein
MKKSNRNRLTVSIDLSHSDPADWVSPAEAARIRGVSRQAISRLIQKGRFRVFRIAGKVLVRRSEVKAYKQAQAGRPRK